MRTCVKSAQVITAALAFVASAAAWAHYPTLDCQRGSEAVECRAGYSDGASASGEAVKLFSYDDELLHSLKADADSRVRFPLTEGEFYISFDPGHDQPAEVDYIELD